jgi:hypothetical protein
MICTCLPSGRETTQPAPLTFSIGSASRHLTAIAIRASAAVLTGTASSIVIASTGLNEGCGSFHEDADLSEAPRAAVVGCAEELSTFTIPVSLP